MIRDLLHRIGETALSAQIATAFTVLGAGVLLGRAVVDALRSPAPDGAQPARHHGGRVRAHATAAAEAARKARLLTAR